VEDARLQLEDDEQGAEGIEAIRQRQYGNQSLSEMPEREIFLRYCYGNQ
jgi:hypothetical protein